MELKSLSAKTLKEIALVALTYRVSNKSIASLFDTTIEDVEIALKMIDDLEISLHYLNQEVLYDDEFSEKLPYINI